MIENIRDVATADGQMESFCVHPDRPGPFPVVVIYMDAPGIREELYDFTRRIAAEGYFAVLPDLYYRRGRVRLDLSSATDPQRKEMFDHMRSLSNAGVAADTEALLAHLTSEPAARPGPKGCVGYCMSGQFVMTVAGTFPDDFQACVSCYGVGIVTDREDSPHNLAANVQGEMFFAFAEKDEYVPDASIEVLRETLSEAGVASEIEIYPDTEHGFCFPERSWCYVKPAAEDVWQKSFAMWSRL